LVPRGGAAFDQNYSANWQVLEEREGGTTKRQYVWSPVYVDALVLRDRDADNDGSHTLEERLYVQQDANYNVTAVMNTSGTVQERYLYDPYGARSIFDASYGSRGSSSYAWAYGHQGLRSDSETQLIYNRHHMFSPGRSRFIQIDPLVYVDRLSVYQFVGDSPIDAIDPLGLAKCDLAGVIESAIVDAIAKKMIRMAAGRSFKAVMKKALLVAGGAVVANGPLSASLGSKADSVKNRRCGKRSCHVLSHLPSVLERERDERFISRK
jgi:RHS repeat-associated protein